MSKQIHSLLIAKTTKDPYVITGNAGYNGTRAWQKISALYGKVHPQARRRILEMLMRPTAAKGYMDVMGAIENWERLLRKYAESAPAPLPDDVMIVGFQGLLPEKLLNDLLSLKEDVKDFEGVKEYVLRQVNARRTDKELGFEIQMVEPAATKEGQSTRAPKEKLRRCWSWSLAKTMKKARAPCCFW